MVFLRVDDRILTELDRARTTVDGENCRTNKRVTELQGETCKEAEQSVDVLELIVTHLDSTKALEMHNIYVLRRDTLQEVWLLWFFMSMRSRECHNFLVNIARTSNNVRKRLQAQ